MLINQFTPGKRMTPAAPALAQLRKVPFQPSDTPADKLFMGAELGFVFFAAQQAKPRPGDVVTVLGTPGNYVALAAEAPVQRNPIFSPGCRCACPSSAGLAFYLSSVARNSLVHVLDATTAVVKQTFGLADLWFGRGLAVDPDLPHDCFILDDRRVLRTIQTQANPSSSRNYFWLVKFALSGNQYTLASYTGLTDPDATSTAFLDTETADTDPPNFTTNGLSVIDSNVELTLFNAPARYLRLVGASLVLHSLTQGGSPYAKGLRGNLVAVEAKPAPRQRRYVIATAGGTYEIAEINATDEVTRTFTIDTSPRPRQLASVCNRLLILCSNQAYVMPTPENNT